MGFVLRNAGHLPPSEWWDTQSEVLPGANPEEAVSGRVWTICWSADPSEVDVVHRIQHITCSLQGLFSFKERHKQWCQWAFKKRETWPFWVCLHSFFDQKSVPVLINKASRACHLSWICTNLNWLEGKSKRVSSYLLPKAFCVFFIAIFKGLENSNLRQGTCNLVVNIFLWELGLGVEVPISGLVTEEPSASQCRSKAAVARILYTICILCVGWFS